MSSTRCPGKSLRLLQGKPLIQYVLERMEHSALLDHLVLATSDDPSDDALERFCRDYGVDCVRGPLLNVAARFKQVLDRYDHPVFARICGDRPLYDQDLVDQGIRLFAEGEHDLVTNAFPKTYPEGQAVEIVLSEAYRRAFPQMSEPDDLEHVTKYFYRHAHAFRILNFTAPTDWSRVNLSANTKADVERIEKIIAAMTRPHWTYHIEELMEIARRDAPAEEPA